MEKSDLISKEAQNGKPLVVVGNAPQNMQPPPAKSFKTVLKINPKLLPVKLLVFLIHGGVAALFPYFALHMMSVGISIKEIAVILFLLPIVSSIGPPIGGFLADRVGNYKIVLIIFTILSVILHTLLWFGVPFYENKMINQNSTLENSNFTVNLPCGISDFPDLRLTTDTPRKLHHCAVKNNWQSAELTNCTSNCIARGYSNPRMCFGAVNSRDGYCFALDNIDTLKAHLTSVQPMGNITWSPSSFAFPLRNIRDLDNARCVSNDISPVMNCSVSCEAKSTNEVICRESVWRKIGDRLTTLALYFTWRFLSFTAIRVVFPLSDAAVLEIAKQENGDFGIQRLFASVGFCIVPPISGWLIDVAKKRTGSDDYSPAFYIFGALNLMAAGLMVCMKFGARKPQANIWKSVGVVLRIPNVAAFVVAIFMSGCAFGVIVNYLFLFMKGDPEFIMKSPGWLFGLINTVGYLLSIPLLFFSTPLIRIFGHENIVAAGLLCYAGRFLLYSYTYNPFLILPIEVLTAVTQMMLVVLPQFAIKTAPRYLATLVGLFGAVNFGLGGGIGPLTGGFMVHALGYRQTFRIWSGICAGVGIIYFLLYHLVLKRLRTTILPATDVPEVISKLPVITQEEVQPLAPGIETIVKPKDAPYYPSRPHDEQFHRMRDNLENQLFDKDGDPKTFRSLKEQHDRLLPEADIDRYNLSNNQTGALPPRDWRPPQSDHRRSSNF
ncbi:uncharacterized protein LOC129584763 [Paramacrobiotus metropolitanus]|uniref:uncharacterized protein LOC129584763 n=1 Tax=Paramacrobiotus metropolitanus TaxID=2943436 RepID=UPI00244643FA|nr:uncharacterized protein LOC129584763 [Paramacrobiotus metropolitanus]